MAQIGKEAMAKTAQRMSENPAAVAAARRVFSYAKHLAWFTRPDGTPDETRQEEQRRDLLAALEASGL
jgi:hypothetical protein